MRRRHPSTTGGRAARAVVRRATLAGALLTLAACGNTEITQPAPEDLSGEYTYEVTGAGGTCDELPRASGTGVTRITQDQTWAEECFERDLCDGESCVSGTVEGNVLREESSIIVQDGACLILRDVVVTLTKASDGTLARRMENQLSYDSGDCTGRTLPCTRWQTSTQSKCPAPCYDSLCAGTAAAPKRTPGAPISWH